LQIIETVTLLSSKPLKQSKEEVALSASPSLGSEVRELRKARKLTLQALSEQTGISLSYLSAIERDVGNPSVEIVRSIADALAVDVDWFFSPRHGKGPMERAHVVRANNRRNLNVLYGSSPSEIGYVDSLLSSTIGGRFYMGVSVYEPGSTRETVPYHRHKGEEHGVVIKGEFEMTIGDEVILLKEGDSYSFDATLRHHGRNPTDRETVLVWGVSPIVIPKDVEEK